MTSQAWTSSPRALRSITWLQYPSLNMEWAVALFRRRSFWMRCVNVCVFVPVYACTRVCGCRFVHVCAFVKENECWKKECEETVCASKQLVHTSLYFRLFWMRNYPTISAFRLSWKAVVEGHILYVLHTLASLQPYLNRQLDRSHYFQRYQGRLHVRVDGRLRQP